MNGVALFWHAYGLIALFLGLKGHVGTTLAARTGQAVVGLKLGQSCMDAQFLVAQPVFE